jgi:hypothetical protein
MYFKIDSSSLLWECEKKLEKVSRKEEIDRLNEILELTALARVNVVHFCDLDEHDFRLIFMEPE